MQGIKVYKIYSRVYTCEVQLKFDIRKDRVGSIFPALVKLFLYWGSMPIFKDNGTVKDSKGYFIIHDVAKRRLFLRFRKLILHLPVI